MLAGGFADDEHLPEVRLGSHMTFEAVLVSALFLADLAVPPQPLKAYKHEGSACAVRLENRETGLTFRLHLVGEIFPI